MSIGVSIKADTKEVERMLKGIKNGSDRVITTALNKTAKNAEVVAVKLLAKDTGFTQSVIRKGGSFTSASSTRKLGRVKITKARWGFKVAAVSASGKRIPVILLKPKQMAKGIKYRGKSGRVLLPGSFFATMPSGHRGVFTRKGKRRLPIREADTVSLPFLFDRHFRKIELRADEMWQKNMQHELDRLLSRV